MTGVPWWDRAAFERRKPYLDARSGILAALRAWFSAQGFTEVETPILQVSPGMEVHLRTFCTALHEPFEAAGRPMHLQTSPEFAMKKLLAAGMPRLHQFARVFRDGERSAIHHPEFTMLEWYRAGAEVDALVADCGALLRAAWEAVPEALRGDGLRWQGKVCDPRKGVRAISVAAAFRRWAGIDILATAPDPLAPDPGLLRKAADAAGIALPQGSAGPEEWEDLFFHIFLERIEPHLGIGVPTALVDYPVSMAALARPSPRDPRVAERFELYAAGLELANGFGELTDADEQRRRFDADNDRRERLYGSRHPVDEDFLAALARMPEAAGIALGFDRLVMLATGAGRIEDVLWAPVA
ncbi:MAG: EF-P lysine aminoacylase EpmA [Alphaproteobacteria bacterium]